MSKKTPKTGGKSEAKTIFNAPKSKADAKKRQSARATSIGRGILAKMQGGH